MKKPLKIKKQRVKRISCDYFSELPDELILNILNHIDDALQLFWFLVVSTRFYRLIDMVTVRSLSFRLSLPVAPKNHQKRIKSLYDTFHLSLVSSIRLLRGKLNDFDVFMLDRASEDSMNNIFLDESVFRDVFCRKFVSPSLNFITNVNVQIPFEKQTVHLYPFLKWKAECWTDCSFSMTVVLAGSIGILRDGDGYDAADLNCNLTLGHTTQRGPINVRAAWNIVFDTDLRVRYNVVEMFLKWLPNVRHAQVADRERIGNLVVKEEWFERMRNGKQSLEKGYDFTHQHGHEHVVKLPKYQCFMRDVRIFLYKVNGEDLDDEMIVSNAFEGVVAEAVKAVWTEGVICKNTDYNLGCLD